jgi:hypothetical protein
VPLDQDALIFGAGAALMILLLVELLLALARSANARIFRSASRTPTQKAQ